MPVWSEEKICAIDSEARTIRMEQYHPDKVIFTIGSADDKSNVSVYLSTEEALAFCAHATRVIKAFAKEIK